MGAVVEAVVEAIAEEVLVFGPSNCKACKILLSTYTHFESERAMLLLIHSHQNRY